MPTEKESPIWDKKFSKTVNSRIGCEVNSFKPSGVQNDFRGVLATGVAVDGADRFDHKEVARKALFNVARDEISDYLAQ